MTSAATCLSVRPPGGRQTSALPDLIANDFTKRVRQSLVSVRYATVVVMTDTPSCTTTSLAMPMPLSQPGELTSMD